MVRHEVRRYAKALKKGSAIFNFVLIKLGTETEIKEKCESKGTTKEVFEEVCN